MNQNWLNIIKTVVKIAEKETGIHFTEKNYGMIEARLSKHINTLGIKNSEEYLVYLEKNKNTETKQIISLLTTHYTSFFREYFHFEEIENKYIHKIVESKTNSNKTIQIWSAACSKGQECYSLSMFFYHLKQKNLLKDCNYHILGSDVDEESVQFAQNGVYYYKDLMQSPLAFVHGNWLRGRNDIKDFVKPKPHIKNEISFDVANLLQINHTKIKGPFDIIFCRNVLIYFNSEQVKKIVQNLLNLLSPNGLLILGISESIIGLNLPVKLLANNIYCHENSEIFKSKHDINTSLNAKKAPWKIMCVDDSPTIISLLKKILVKELGFEVVATASSAKEAREKLKTTDVDLLTLDIHMEGETGLDYLKSDFKAGNHPPVVMLSSLERDGNEAAKQALALGASDYIEKPDLRNLNESSDEIRFKIKTVLENNLPPKRLRGDNNNTSKLDSMQYKEQISSNILGKSQKIKVLIVDDAQTIRAQLRNMLQKSSDIEVIADIEDPRLIETFIQKNRPDVITLDINMPYLSGVDVVKTILPKYPIPTIVVSSLGLSEGNSVMEALEHGAIDYFQKPSLQNLAEETLNLIDKVKNAKNAKLRIQTKNVVIRNKKNTSLNKDFLIALGSSTGGTEAIKRILENLPDEIPPIVITQHIPPIFSQAFAERLNSFTPFRVQEAKEHQIIEANNVYIAPGDKHMEIIKTKDNELKIALSQKDKRNGHRPSVDVLFESIANLGLKKTIGIILTGMGNDGAVGLKKLKETGSKTIGQNEETCVVFGMPKEAIKLQAVDYIEPIEQIANRIISITTKF